MRGSIHRAIARLPIGASIGGILAVLALAGSWIGGAPVAGPAEIVQLIVVALVLVVAVVVADRYPIHVQHHTKVSIMSIPLYLLVMLCPMALAVTAAGIGVLIAELLARKERGSLPSDIVIVTSRWIVVAALSAWTAHVLRTASAPHEFVLLGAAATMSAGDLLTGSFHTASMCGEPAWNVLITTVRATAAVECIQYLMGILGALAAETRIWGIALLVIPSVIVYLAFKDTKEMRNSTRWLLERMADAVDLRDPYTGGHSRRVAAYCAGILDQMKHTGPDVDLIVGAARVHDIGKIGVQDQILNKPGRLTDEERAIMESHAERGAELLTRYPDFVRGVEIVLHHHERWDGTGYPRKLAGYAIPFGARVIAVADSYDAMTSDRPYRRGMAPAQAARILRQGAGTQWDAAIVETFLRSIADQCEQAVAPPPQTAPIPPTDLAQPDRAGLVV